MKSSSFFNPEHARLQRFTWALIASFMIAGVGLAPHVAHAQTTTVTTPLVRIWAEGAAPRPTLGAITHALQLTSGVIVIADNVDSRLHFFSGTGAHLKSVGRDGGGPGEFKSATWVGECARDSVFVFDRIQNRLSVFSASGHYVRQRALTRDPVIVACATDGTIALAQRSGAPPSPATPTRGQIVRLDDRDREIARATDVLFGGERPMAATLRMTAAPGMMVYGAGDSARVFVLGDSGAPRTVRAGVALRKPSEVQRDAAIEQVVMSMPGTKADMEITRTYARRIPAAPVLPSYSALMFDEVTRLLWVQQSVAGDGETVLERRTLTGVLQSTVRIPAELDVFSVRNNVLVARSTNAESGEQSLVLYRLTDAVK